MFEEYLQDASEFLSKANLASKNSEERVSRRYYRASVFYLAGAIEAFVNYVADSFAKAGKLPEHEVAFLNDKHLRFLPEKSQTVEKTEFCSVENIVGAIYHLTVEGVCQHPKSCFSQELIRFAGG